MAITEEQRKNNIKIMTIYMGVVLSLALGFFFAYVGSVCSSMSYDVLDSIGYSMSELSKFHLLPEINTGLWMGAATGISLGLLITYYMKLDTDKNYAYKSTEVAGTGGFMSQKELEKYKKEMLDPEPEDKNLPSPNMIMSENFRRPINSRKMIGNNNVVVVGGAGTGKSRFVVKPNLLQFNASYVTTDPSGEIIYSLGKPLVEHGYKIKIFNISDMEHSNCYNPLHYIRNEAGVSMLIDCFIRNTTTDGADKGDQFFTNAERLLYSACIFYLKDHCTDESKKNFAHVVNMVNSSAVDEMNPMATESELDKLFKDLPKKSLAKKYYTAFKQASGRTLKSIIISCMTRLQPFMTPQVVNLTKVDEMELDKLGNEKIALFIIVPQADRTYSFLASMLYSQLFETLYHIGEQQKANGGSEMLKIPVRCMMDEFANIGEVPEFPSRLSTMRKYNISATVILQDLSQIEAMYKDSWRTLLANSSSYIFLGSQESNTLKYFSEMLGKKTVKDRSNTINKGGKNSSGRNFQNKGREVMTVDELARLDPKDCIVFSQNMRAVLDKKYRYENHPMFSQTADADESNAYLYNQNPAFNTRKQVAVKSLIMAQVEHAKWLEKQQISDSQNANDFKINLNINAAYNQLVINKQKDAIAKHQKLEDCIEMAMQEFDTPIFIGKVKGIQAKTLPYVARQLSISIGKKPVILFSDLDTTSMFGIGIDLDNSGLYEASDNDYIKKISRFDNQMFMIAIMSKAFDNFKDDTICKMQYIYDMSKKEKQQSTQDSRQKVIPRKKTSGGSSIPMDKETQDQYNELEAGMEHKKDR